LGNGNGDGDGAQRALLAVEQRADALHVFPHLALGGGFRSR
jgi:hypothetical protein